MTEVAMLTAFYEEPAASEVCQGDIYSSLLLYRADMDGEPVVRATVKGDLYWQRASEAKHAVVMAERLPGIVITHDCAIDKAFNVAASMGKDLTPDEVAKRSSKADVVVAPIRPVPTEWSEQKLLEVSAGKVLHQFLLPEDRARKWAPAYVDLRWLVTVRLSALHAASRVMSLTEFTRAGLQDQIESFFTNREPA